MAISEFEESKNIPIKDFIKKFTFAKWESKA